MDNKQKIAAVAWRARQNGLTYGEVAAKLTPTEAEALYAEFAAYLKGQRAAAVKERKAAAPEKKKPKPFRVNPYIPRAFDGKEARRLYDMKLNDSQIADRLHTSIQNISNWRRANELPALAGRGRQKKAAS